MGMGGEEEFFYGRYDIWKGIGFYTGAWHCCYCFVALEWGR